MEYAIETENVTKEFRTLKTKPGLIGSAKAVFSRDYKKHFALSDVNIKIKPGEFVGVIGPNGAGKSTLIKVWTGILVPSKGVARVNGLVPYENREKNAKNIGVVFGQRTQLWWDLPVRESFTLLKAIFEVPEKIFKKNMKIFSKTLGIEKYMAQPVRKLSLGERMRCDIAASLLHNPKTVFLDEPTIGLDVEAKQRIREFLKKTNENGATIILTTHDMGDIEELCERIVIVDHGKVIFDGLVDEIRTRFTKTRVVKINFKKSPKSLPKIKGTRVLEKELDKVWIEVDLTKTRATDVIKKLLKSADVDDISIEEPDIEEIIRKIYKEGI